MGVVVLQSTGALAQASMSDRYRWIWIRLAVLAVLVLALGHGTARAANGTPGPFDPAVACPSITVGPAILASGTAGVAFGQTTMTASGGTGPYTFSVKGMLPDGMTFENGVVTGFPRKTGTFQFEVVAEDAHGCVGSQVYVIVIECGPITLSPETVPGGTDGALFALTTFVASGATGLTTFSLTGKLPDGLSFSNGVLAGTPKEVGSFDFSVTAVDGNGCSASRPYTLVIGFAVMTYSIAEGAVGTFFDTYLLVENPNTAPAHIAVVFVRSDGTTLEINQVVGPNTRLTLPYESIPGLVRGGVPSSRGDGDAAVPVPPIETLGVDVTSTSGLPLVVEQAMYWDDRGYHSGLGSVGVTESTRWYFAEGSEALADLDGQPATPPESLFDTYLLLMNSYPTPATVTVTFFLEGGAPPVTKEVSVPATSRVTLFAGAIAALDGQTFGMAVTSDVPIVATRSQYIGTYDGGHGAEGVPRLSTSWLFSEGSSRHPFETFFCIANPGAVPATVTATYRLVGGGSVTRRHTVPGKSRFTIAVAGEDPLLASADFWTSVSSDRPVVVERGMFFPGTFQTWAGAHATPGLLQAGTRFGFAEGVAGQPGGPSTPLFQTYFLLANPGAMATTIDMVFHRENGSSVTKTFTVAPLDRLTVSVAALVPELSNEGFATTVTSTNDVPFIAERSIYFGPVTRPFQGGTNSLGVPLPQVP